MKKLDATFAVVEEVCVMLNYSDIRQFFEIALPHALPTLVLNHNEHVLQEISKRTKQNVCTFFNWSTYFIYPFYLSYF
jgi:hypothetical protein